MDLVRVQVDASGINKALDKLRQNAVTFPMEILAEGLLGAIDDVIQSEGNGEWQPLSPNTIRLHPRRAGGMLLQDTGLLGNMQATQGEDWVEATSPAPYAGYHITGTKWMPARDWTGIDLESLLNDFAEIVVNEVVR